MELIKVESITDISKGDLIIITGDIYVREPFKVKGVKVTEKDGTEIILDNKQNNTYFNLGMFLGGKSWVKECYKIK